MSYDRKYFGVKLISGFYDVKELNLPEDLDKKAQFDFMLKDRLVSEHNGNTSYDIDVIEGIEGVNMDAVINGWKLSGILVNGNHFGNWTKFCLIDKNGEKYCPSEKEPPCAQGWYGIHQTEMIHDTLMAARKFTIETPSVRYLNIIKGFDVPDVMSLDNFEHYNERMVKYIKDYKEMLQQFEGEDANLNVVDRLKKAFVTQISKFYKVTVSDD